MNFMAPEDLLERVDPLNNQSLADSIAGGVASVATVYGNLSEESTVVSQLKASLPEGQIPEASANNFELPDSTPSGPEMK